MFRYLEGQLFHASTIVMSQGTELDPVLNYGNQAALNLRYLFITSQVFLLFLEIFI